MPVTEQPNTPRANSMPNPYYPLDEILELCHKRNYTEQVLGFRQQPGFIEERFRKAHEVMLLRSSNSRSPKNFTMSFPTASYTEKDRIQFKFNMDYNPVDDTLRLRGITALLNPTDYEGRRQWESQKIFLLTDTQRLPDSREIYNRLTEHRLQQARAIYSSITIAPTTRNSFHV